MGGEECQRIEAGGRVAPVEAEGRADDQAEEHAQNGPGQDGLPQRMKTRAPEQEECRHPEDQSKGEGERRGDCRGLKTARYGALQES